MTEKFDKEAVFMFGKKFDKLNKSQRIKVLSEVGEMYPIEDIEKAIKMFAKPEYRKDEFNPNEHRLELLYDGLNKSIFTDGIQMILKKDAAKKVLDKVIDKVIEQVIRDLMFEKGLSWKDAMEKAKEIVNNRRKEYEKMFPDYKHLIPKELGAEIKLIGVKHHSGVVVFVFKVKDKREFVNGNYLAHMLKYLSDAKMTTNGIGSPVIFSEKGEAVGFLMPMQLDEQ